ncbi:hypothetical protein V8G54_034235 [Vigna mungo]|uniref:Reverse transcriptase domain-containing protein n=1 Tax=Vigna mungo TaxID=3915 RepID=A0AAQ3MPV2_VIGMU
MVVIFCKTFALGYKFLDIAFRYFKYGLNVNVFAWEREIKKLKAQLHDLDHYIESKIKEKQSPFPDTLSPPPFTPYRPLFQPSSSTGHKSKQPYSLPTATAFRNKQKPRTSIPSVSTQETRITPTQTLSQSPIYSSEKEDYFQDSQDPYAQFTIENTSIRSSEYTSSDENTENYSDNYSESSDEYANVLMANTASSSTRQEPIYESLEEIEPPLRDNPSKPNSGPWFSIDDLSPNQWRARLIEFGAWLDTKLIKDADSYKVIEEFCCRMTGTLKEWYHNLGPVRQDQFHNLGSTAVVLGALHEEFIGDRVVIDRKIRQESFEMKCCSLNMKDLDRHFKRMLQRFYLLNGANDVSLKNTYVAFLPVQLQSELNRMAMAAQKDFSTMTMGQIHQMTKEARKGHFAKSCPNKADKAIKLVTSLKIRDEEVESLYSEQSSPDEDTVFALRNSSEEEYSEEETLPIFSTEEINSLNPSPPHPNIEVQILPTKFNKPVKAIAYIDTGAQKTMMNPDILPEELWSKKTSYFMAADGKIFKTELITKTFIEIKFFPDCIIWAKVIGSKLPGKDNLIGMDIFSEADKLQILPSGLKYKREFKPFVETSTLFSLSASPSEMEEIKKKLLSLCADNHGGFSHPRPLWKNPNFFVKLPFKLNEDVNPTKATDPGMTPSDLQLARQECQELLTQGLIEPTHSNWACQAFYVEKRSERVRGKKRLLIDYKPLNHFLQDDKFPIPKASSLPILLKESNMFSKFDLKSGFWQIGIDPSERHKTAFCIPNAQYQWTVLPFGLKVAPSLFQKAMT